MEQQEALDEAEAAGEVPPSRLLLIYASKWSAGPLIASHSCCDHLRFDHA